MDVFSEALRHLDALQDLASEYVAKQELPVDAAVRDAALDTVIDLRRYVIKAANRTEVDRTNLDAAALKEGAAVAALSSLQTRLSTVNELIEGYEKMVEDQNRRGHLEEANAKLNKAKKRVTEKQDLLENREKKLKQFQKELAPALKLGTALRISEFDDVGRLERGFGELPRPLQFLYAQFRTVKKLFHLPIDVGIVPMAQLLLKREGGIAEVEGTPLEATPVSKKQRLSDRKGRHGPEEKRRKRWYEAVAGRESGSYDEWANGQQKALQSSVLHCSPPNMEAELDSCRKYEMLLEVLDVAKKHTSSKKPTKKRRHLSSSKTVSENSVRFPLPIPEGALAVEVKFLDEEREMATLIFSWIQGQSYVLSSPDALLCRTVQRGDNAIAWEQQMKKSHPRYSRAVTSTYGYPFSWAQELSGMGILKDLKPAADVTAKRLLEMNKEMLQQQEYFLDFVVRVHSQALDLGAFRAGVQGLKDGVRHGTRASPDGPDLVQFRKLSTEKFRDSQTEAQEDRSYAGIAVGKWAAVMKREAEENGDQMSSHQSMDVDVTAPKKEVLRIRFYPQLGKQATKEAPLSRSETYYETDSRAHGGQLRLTPCAKLKEVCQLDGAIPAVLTGPLAAEASGTRNELIFGHLTVQKGIKIPKKYVGVLPTDYERRFFPFNLVSQRRLSSSDLKIPESQKELSRIYRVIIQYGHIRLTALIQIDLLKPLHPLVSVESVLASARFRKQISAPVRDAKTRGSLEGKAKSDHIRTERERAMKKDTDAMKMRDGLELAALRLETLEQDDAVHKKGTKLPSFCSDDAKVWIGERLHDGTAVLPEDAVGKLEALLWEWCRRNAKGVAAVDAFFQSGSGSKSRPKTTPKGRRSNKPTKEPRKERPSRSRTETRNPVVHDGELEQGEIPAEPKLKYATRHRSSSRRETSHRVRPRTRSPPRTRMPPDPRGRHVVRAPVRLGQMRMDAELPRDREKGSMSTSRLRR